MPTNFFQEPKSTRLGSSPDKSESFELCILTAPDTCTETDYRGWTSQSMKKRKITSLFKWNSLLGKLRDGRAEATVKGHQI